MRLPLLLAAVALALPASAAAAPPPNDNYLASTTTISRADGTMAREYSDNVDTSEATTQPDLFNPDRDGLPFGGGDPEPTSCGGPSYGKTVWWDFKPPTAGGAQIRANGGFDVVVAVYTWSATTTRITRTVVCQNDELGSETVDLPDVRKGTNYTIQVGGSGNTGGPLGMRLDWFPDRDADGVFDAIDDCPSLAGSGKGGCPPELRAAPRVLYAASGTALRITSLAIDSVPKGARAEVRCGRCGRKVTRRATRSGTLGMPGFVGRLVRAGDRIEVRITKGPSGRGRFRYGAIGKYYRWPIERGKLGRKVTRCLEPGSKKPTKCR